MKTGLCLVIFNQQERQNHFMTLVMVGLQLPMKTVINDSDCQAIFVSNINNIFHPNPRQGPPLFRAFPSHSNPLQKPNNNTFPLIFPFHPPLQNLSFKMGQASAPKQTLLQKMQMMGCLGLFDLKIYLNIWLIFSYSAMYTKIYLRKFLIESSEKTGKQIKSPSGSDPQQNQDTYIYYNILNPSNKIQCDQCKRDITKATKIMIDDTDYCAGCFANLEQYPETYRVINKLDFPLFEQDWTADQDLLLFEGLEKHGFGNWGEISDFIATNKTRQDVEDHYQHIYLAGSNFLPPQNLLSKRDANGFLIQNNKESHVKKVGRQSTKTVTNNATHFHRAALTVNQTNKTGNNPAEIVGYMPKRGDFEVQYDNDAELLLAEMEFNDDDTEEEKAMKFRLIDIYNHKLNERIKRKQFVISRKLLDLREQIRLDKTRTKEEKEIYNMMKVFARFNTAEEHERLVQGIIKEKEIRQRIEELKQLKKKGFRTLGEVQDQLQNKKKKDQKAKKKEIEIYGSDKITRRMRKDPTVQKSQKRVLFVNREQEDLCKALNMTFKQYMMMKETIIRESVRLGIISKDETTQMFKVDKSISQAVFDFLVEQEDIIMRTSDEVSAN